MTCVCERVISPGATLCGWRDVNNNNNYKTNKTKNHQPDTELTAGFLKKKKKKNPETHTKSKKKEKRKEKETVFNQTKQDRMRLLEEVFFFRSCVQRVQKQFHSSFACWILAEGRGHETDSMKTAAHEFQNSTLSVHPFSVAKRGRQFFVTKGIVRSGGAGWGVGGWDLSTVGWLT